MGLYCSEDVSSGDDDEGDMGIWSAAARGDPTTGKGSESMAGEAGPLPADVVAVAVVAVVGRAVLPVMRASKTGMPQKDRSFAL
mmetsp:Transcript_74085/g.154508  ORF Transcript_74085/g.154508 Transcript_74085/m.154508 type:complete len:84 (+) Transcript_74085:465-716(+)